jgi:hypothetical protein
MARKKSAFYLAVLALVAATAGPAMYFGHVENAQAKMIEDASQRLAVVPTHFGPWEMRKEESLSDSALKMLGCSNHLCRTYSNTKTGEIVGFVMLVGPGGPLAVHTPEICMSSREYENIRPMERMEIDSGGKKQEFFSTVFRTRSLEGQRVDVFYGWSRDGSNWEAPLSPRMALGPLPVLYKLQVACADPLIPTDGQRVAAAEFLSDLLPILVEGARRSETQN